MRSTVLFSILIFAPQSQASFLSRMLYKSGIYESFCWSISDVPLSIYHDTVETANNEPSSTVNSTDVDEPDDRQIKSEPLQKQLIQKKVQDQKSKKDAPVLQDLTGNVGDAQPVDTSVQSSEISQSQLVPSVDNQLKTLIEKGEYGKISELGKEMNDEEFLKQLCPVIETLEQYKEVTKYLKGRKMVASFYVYGNIEVVKGAIIEFGVYDERHYYVENGNLESALPLALKEDRHDRFVELLDVRKGITAEVDGRFKSRGWTTSFENFMDHFLRDLAPWKDGTALGRFLIPRGEELRDKYPGILDTLCQELMNHLHFNLDLPKAKGLLMDLIGQPSLLTPVTFARGFLYNASDEDRSNFIKYGWREIIQICLETKCRNEGKELWLVMQKDYPEQFPGQFPITKEALAAVLKHFPTKQQKEDEWIKNDEEWFMKSALIFYKKLKPHDDIFNLFPGVLWTIISQYAATPIDSEVLTVPQK